MGTSAELQRVVAGWDNQPPFALERHFADYKEKALIRKSGRGGGKNSVHLSRDECVYPILGLPAHRPADAAAIAQKFAALHCQASLPPGLNLPKFTLLECVGKAVDIPAIPMSKGEAIDPLLMAAINAWELILCLDPFVAYIVSNGKNGEKETYFFHEGPLQWGALHRMTMLSGKFLLEVGEILADTYARRDREAVARSSEANFTLTRQRPESAGDLRQEGPPAPSENPTRVNGSEGSHSAPEGNNDGNSSQGHPVSDANQVSIGKLSL